MNDVLLAVLLGTVLCGLLGLLVPRLIAALPEPADDVWAEKGPDSEIDLVTNTSEGSEPEGSVSEGGDSEGGQPEDGEVAVADRKRLNAEIAAAPGLALRCALAAAVCGGLIGWGTGLEWSLLWLVPLVPVCVALSVVDWHTRLLPRVVVVPTTLAVLVAMVAVGLATGERDAVVRALVGMVAVRSFFWVMWALTSGKMGFGDVRLAAIVGLVLGWVGWGALAIGVWVGFFVFSTPGLVLAIAKRDRSLLKKPFPYGPFMLVGALVGLVWGTAFAERIWG